MADYKKNIKNPLNLGLKAPMTDEFFSLSTEEEKHDTVKAALKQGLITLIEKPKRKPKKTES